MNNIFHFKNIEMHKNKLVQRLGYLKKINHVRTITASLMALFLLISVGCSDEFLDKQQLNSLASGNFWQTEKDATMGVMGCYDILQQDFIYNGPHWTASMGLHLDGIADNAVYRWNWQQYEWFVRNNVAPDTWYFQMTWIAFYKGIARCNETIFRIGEMTEEQINPDVSKQLLAEAKFVRALLYADMTSMFHDIPLVTEIQEATALPAKSARKDVVDFVQSELLACVNDLPATNSVPEWGRATKGAAYALLSRTNLFNIGNGGTYEKAAEYAKNVMDIGAFSLHGSYEKLFKPESEINYEVILPVTFSRGPEDNGSSFGGTWGPTVGNYWLYPISNLVDDYYCTDGKPIKDPVTGEVNSLYNPDNIWENRDPRLVGTVCGEGALWIDQVITAGDMSAEPTGFALRKWREEANTTDDRFDSPMDFYVFRYAHVLLMRAEALIMSGNYTDPDVNASINALRARVGMPSVGEAEGAEGALGQQEYIDIIRHEWRVETAFEGWRYFNVVRWGQLEEAYNKVNEIDLPKYPSIVREHVYAPRLEVFPIPTTELDRNENLVQHDLW